MYEQLVVWRSGSIGIPTKIVDLAIVLYQKRECNFRCGRTRKYYSNFTGHCFKWNLRELTWNYIWARKKSIHDVKYNLPAQIDGVENQVFDPVHIAYSCVSECSRVFLIELIFDCLARQYKCKVRWLNMNWKKNSQK